MAEQMGCGGLLMFCVGIAALFYGSETAGLGILLIILGVLLFNTALKQGEDTQARHSNDYGKVAQCPKCHSTKVYAMTFDDKRASVNFWGSASPKLGKHYHCDHCDYEW